jgi:transposase
MVRPDFAKWQESAETMRQLSIEAEHPRSRERYQALYIVGSGQCTARQWAQVIGREDETVLRWIHDYNAGGSGRVSYRHSGGVRPLFSAAEQRELVDTVTQSKPVDHQQLGHGWNLKKLCRWVEEKRKRKVSRNTLRTILKQAGLSWKKCKKLLSKAKPDKRTEFVEQFQSLYERMCRDEVVIVYLDEAHIHQDLDYGYSWSPLGESTWVASTSPGLSARIDWYGAYNFSAGRCFLWQGQKCDSEQTVDFLHQLAQWLGKTAQQVVIIWDNVSYHKKQLVQDTVTQLGFELLPLPTYSPDLNPIEGLWKWLRQEVTQHYCHPSIQALFLACTKFIDTINLTPEQVIQRLWPKFELDPQIENLRFSS